MDNVHALSLRMARYGWEYGTHPTSGSGPLKQG